jgi:phage terminase large subunit-like protein
MNLKALNRVIEGRKEERVFLCEQDFSLFMAYYFNEYIKYPFAPFHYDMFRDLKDLRDGIIDELAWIMFRESAKTSFAKIFFVYLICYKLFKYPNADSFDKTNSENLLFDVVTILQTNKKIKADFGELYNKKRDPQEASIKQINNFLTNNGIRVEAHSTQESVRGRLFKDQRPDFVLLDDFETNKTKDSAAYTQQVIKHIDEFKTGLAPRHRVLYLCNYITELGSVQTLIDRAKIDPSLRVRMVGAEINGKPAWKGKYVMSDVELPVDNKQREDPVVSLESKKRSLGSTVYSAEMLNQPVDKETQEFKKHLFTPIKWESVRTKDTRNFITIDTAVSQKAEADYTGITRNYVDRENKWNLKARRYKINAAQLIDMLFILYREDKPELIGIEKTIFLQAIKPFLDEEMRKRNVFLPIYELEHQQTAKHTRIRGLLPRYESGSIFHIEGECDDLESELLRFPKAINDDVMDSTAYQLQIAQAPTTDSPLPDQEEPNNDIYDD